MRHIGRHQPVDNLRQIFVRIGDLDLRSGQQLAERRLPVLAGAPPAQDRRRIDDAEHPAVPVDHRKARMRGRGLGKKAAAPGAASSSSGSVSHLGRHHLLHPGQREWIDAVFARQMMAAACDLLGQDRAAHQQHGHHMRGARRR